jgi:proteasome assembly chaperone (PAC2) family protein
VEHVIWTEQPALRSPVLVVAFSGWNDAGDAASLAVQQLISSVPSRLVATIDPEEFFEFQATRPQVRLRDGAIREIVWPPNDLYAASAPGGDLLLLSGTEPQLRWRTFCREITELCKAQQVRMVITLGALLADVAHSRPVNVLGTASDQSLIERYDLQRSRYEGPTGIVGVLQHACNEAGIASASLWAAVPAYAPGTPSPKAALALVQRVTDMIGMPLDTSNLELASADYEHDVQTNLDEDDDLAGYVRRLEAVHDSGITDDDDEDDEEPDESDPGLADAAGAPGSADRLVEEVERFLRDQGPSA